ncbi:hypothetical protein ERJ75_001398100 [Trypanosoma vivax]|nr:hypothetical protein ERJ75_001398100 [Trypanosoma vivax]
MQPRRLRFCPQRRMRSALPHSDRAPAGNRASSACAVLSAQPCVSAGGDRRRLTRGARRACAECGVPSARRNQLCAFGCRVCALVRLRPARLLVEPSPALRTPGALSSTGTGCESSQGEPSWRPRRRDACVPDCAALLSVTAPWPSLAQPKGGPRNGAACAAVQAEVGRWHTTLNGAAAASDPRRLASASGRRRRSALCASRPSRSRAPTTRTVKAGVRCGGRGRAHGQPRRRHSTERRRQQLVRADCAKRIAGWKRWTLGRRHATGDACRRHGKRTGRARKGCAARHGNAGDVAWTPSGGAAATKQRRSASAQHTPALTPQGKKGRRQRRTEEAHSRRSWGVGRGRVECAPGRGVGASAHSLGAGRRWRQPEMDNTGGRRGRRETLWRVVHKGSVKMQRVALSAMLACGLALALWSLPALASNGQGKALSEDKVADVCKLSALLKKMSLEAKKLGSVATLATTFEASAAEEDMHVMREALGSAARLLRRRARRGADTRNETQAREMAERVVRLHEAEQTKALAAHLAENVRQRTLLTAAR